ncbi:MAG: NYN domain-containing protein [Candidatus Izimaplasma sp.]|nr:NYN domain-containing protein [Candidatus Izimaplasma bacterium]
MKTITIAIYLDVENIKGLISFEDLLDDIRLKVVNEMEDVDKAVFALKKAVGDRNNLKRFRTQLSELNFTIEDAPHIANKKNRADLMISVDALEKLHVGNPEFDLFVFLTSDSDYSIVMNSLRKYNKHVWMIASERDSQKTVFKSSTDKILIIEDFTIYKDQKTPSTHYKKQTNGNKLDYIKPFTKTALDRRALAGILKVMRSYQEEKVYTTLDTNNRFRQVEQNLNLSQTKFKKFKDIYRVLFNSGLISPVNKSYHKFIINDKQQVLKFLNYVLQKK